MKKNLSRKRKRSNPKNSTSFSKEKKPSPPKIFQLNGFELLELNENVEINPITSITQEANIKQNEPKTKENNSSRKEYTRLRGKARNVESYYIKKYGLENIKENCFNCLMTDFNANELLYFNNRKDLLYYLKYCFSVKKRLLFFNKKYFLDNKNEIMKFGNFFLNGWKFFIPKTMCKSCFIQMINKRLFTTHIKSIFSDIEKNSRCKTSYRDYALFNPKFRSAFSLTKRILNKAKCSRKLSKTKKIIKNQKINEEENKQSEIQQNHSKNKKLEKMINPDIIFNENDNTFIINKNILGDISIKINEINKSNINSLNNEQKINGLNNSINKNSMKEKKKLNNNKKKEAVLKTNSKNNKNNSINSRNEINENNIAETNTQISENINVTTKEDYSKQSELKTSILPLSKSIIEQFNSLYFENNNNDENTAKCINLCIEQMKTQIHPLIKCIISYLNEVNSKLIDLIKIIYFVNISTGNFIRKLSEKQNKNSENNVNYNLNDFKSFYKAMEFNAIYYRRFSVISEFLFQKTSENLLILFAKLKKNGNDINLFNTIYGLEEELEQINLNSILCNEKIEESIINFADNFKCFFALVNDMS